MYRLRRWSVRNARFLKKLYLGIENGLVKMHPLLDRIGYERVDKLFLGVEKVTKGALFDSQSCGQCVIGSTGTGSGRGANTPIPTTAKQGIDQKTAARQPSR